MSISSIHYTPSLRRPLVVPELDYALIDRAQEEFAAGAFAQAAHTIFAHLFPGQTVDLNASFSFAQGSSKVTAKIVDQQFSLTVPVVRLPSGGAAIAALRYLLTRVNGSGQMYQARLHGDDVVLEFTERLSSLHPQKLLETVRRMPFAADRHDDWMMSQFNAAPLDRVEIAALTDEEFTQAAAFWQQHWNDVDELMKESQRKRSLFFLNEVTAFALNRVRVTIPLGGSLFPLLMEAGGTFNDDHVDAMKRESALVKAVKDMKAVTPDELRRSLGHQSYAIAPLPRGTPEQLTNFFGPGRYTESIIHYQNNGQSIDAALALLSSDYYLLANFTWPNAVATALQDGLAEASDKPWREAAAVLLGRSRALLEEFVGPDDTDQKDEPGDQETVQAPGSAAQAAGGAQ